MPAFGDLRRGLGQLRESLAEGWRELRERAGNAMTRFHVGTARDGVETSDERLARATPRWGVLPVEVIEQTDRVEVRLEVPGLEPDDLDLHVQDDHLIVAGHKQVEREERRGRYHLMERAYGRFERIVPLPCAVLEDRARARYRRGVLRVTLPRRQADVARRIKVESHR